jgi:hypothetical protein
MARNAGIERRLASGFVLHNGLLVKGSGRDKVELRPTALIPSRSGEQDYNAFQDAFAVHLGAECDGPNRYRLGGFLLLDANGACRDEGECPECGSSPIVRDVAGKVVEGGEYRWSVPVTGRPGEWMDCRRCVTDEEHRAAVAAHEAALAVRAAAASRAGGRR